MREPADTTVFDFARDLHAEARTVLDRTPRPQNAFEVAVVLETEGYDRDAVRALGSPDIFDLARRVCDVADLYADPSAEPAAPPLAPPPAPDSADDGPRRITAALLARCVWYSLPWLLALAALGAGRVSFWSTITTVQIASAVSLGLFFALIVTGAFIQAFARRGTFYALQGNRPLVGWVTRWSLGGAAVTAVVVDVGCYALLDHGLRAYTPASTRAFLWFGLSISAMLLSLAPLYMTRSFGAVALSVGAGATFVAVGGRMITTGDYINPYTAMRVQLAGIWIVVVLAAAADIRALRRTASPAPGAAPVRARPPRLAATARSVAGYACYGACFFALIIVDQLTAGGLWTGTFVYNGRYELAVGVALLILVPTLTYVAAVNEVFAATVREACARVPVAGLRALNAEMAGFYRRHLRALVLTGLVSAAVLLALGSRAAAVSSITAALPTVYWLFAGAMGAYLLLAVGAFNTGLLFSLARPAVPAVATAAGTVTSLLTGGLAASVWRAGPGALTGLAAGTAVFAVTTTIAATRAFARFDATYYGAF